MSSVNRRAFLSGAVSVSATAAAMVPTLNAPAESAELLELGRELDRLEAEFINADERYEAAKALYAQLCPPVPDELVVTGDFDARYYECFEDEVDIDGNVVYPPNYIGKDGKTYASPPRKIISSRKLNEWHPKFNLRTKFGREAKRKLALAREYESAVESAKERSGLDAAYWARIDAERALQEVALAVRKIAPITMTGVVIHARTLLVYDRADSYSKDHFRRAAMWNGVPLAEAIVRLAPPARA